MPYPLPRLGENHQIIEEGFCSGYMDIFEKWNTGFDCPIIEGVGIKIYCCGTSTYKYCCLVGKDDEINPTIVHENEIRALGDYQIPLALGIICITFLLFVLTIFTCFYCSCCFVYKKRQEGNNNHRASLYRIPTSRVGGGGGDIGGGLTVSSLSTTSLATSPLDSEEWSQFIPQLQPLNNLNRPSSAPMRSFGVFNNTNNNNYLHPHPQLQPRNSSSSSATSTNSSTASATNIYHQPFNQQHQNLPTLNTLPPPCIGQHQQHYFRPRIQTFHQNQNQLGSFCTTNSNENRNSSVPDYRHSSRQLRFNYLPIGPYSSTNSNVNVNGGDQFLTDCESLWRHRSRTSNSRPFQFLSQQQQQLINTNTRPYFHRLNITPENQSTISNTNTNANANLNANANENAN